MRQQAYVHEVTTIAVLVCFGSVLQGQGTVIWEKSFPGRVGAVQVVDEQIYACLNLWETESEIDVVALASVSNGGQIRDRIVFERLSNRREDLPGCEFRARLTSDNGRIYLYNNRGEVLCVKPEPSSDRLEIVWSCSLPKILRFSKRDAVDAGNPLPEVILSGEELYCMTGAGVPESNDTGVPALVAIDKQSGSIKWRFDVDSNDVYGNWGTPLLCSNNKSQKLLIACCNGELLALSPDGNLVWKTPLMKAESLKGRAIPLGLAPPLQVGDLVVIGTTFDIETSSSEGSAIQAFDLGTGKKIWEFRDPRFDSCSGKIGYHKDTIFALARSGTVYAIDASNGSKVGTRDLLDEAALYSGIQCYGESVFVATLGTVYELSRDSELRIKNSFEPDEGITCIPAIQDEQIIVGSGNKLVAFKF